MFARIARLQMRRVMVVVVMSCGPLMLVYSESVMMLGMVVVGVGVDVQRGALARGRGQDQSEQDRY
jgi:hypothetical protein